MTREERIFVKAEDIKEIEITCSKLKCGTRTTFSLEGGIQFLYKCPGCNSDWFGGGNDDRKQSILDFKKALGELRGIAGAPFDLRLRIHEESVSGA